MLRIVHVWYDEAGHIAAVGQALGGLDVVPLRRPGLPAISVAVDSGDVAELHNTHRVDTDRLVLVPSDR